MHPAPMIGLLLLLLPFSACGSSSFSGSSKGPQPVAKQEAQATPPPQAAKASIDDHDEDEPEEELDTEDTLETEDGLGEVPDHAISKGSFSAWTIPADPFVRQPYRIIIEVRLPSDVDEASYRKSDLSGFVSGTDNYRQQIGTGVATLPPGYTPILGPPPTREIFDVGNGRARLTVWVPGANFLVRDVISIESNLLGEEQQLEITF